MYSVEVKAGVLIDTTILHTWLVITNPDGSQISYGFYPKGIEWYNKVYGQGEVKILGD